MIKMKLKGIDCNKDPKKIQAVLAEYKVHIIKSRQRGANMTYIIKVDAESASSLLYDLNTKTEYGVRAVYQKSVKK